MDMSCGKRKRGQEYEDQQRFVNPIDPHSSAPPCDSLSKRKREVTQEQQANLGSILQRVVHWLVNNQDILPKTLQKLEGAITQMCSSLVYISEEIIFYHLLFNGAIEMATEEGGEGGAGRVMVKGKKEIKPYEDFVGILLPSYYQTREEERTQRGGISSSGESVGGAKKAVGFSDDFGYALKRSRDWVERNNGLHTTWVPKSSFLRSLKQLCSFKRGVPPSVVVQALVKRGWVGVGGGGCWDFQQNQPQRNQGLSKISYNMEALKAADARCKYVVEERVDVAVVVERVEKGRLRDAWGIEGALGENPDEEDVEMMW
uniref:Uncharacterized protein n=1 Tax=Paramoeba aestuarina TaxID=180227 RepID=A0A7S4KML0_9EUKA|mmetsp:Transcript_21821/g.33907  ORF Transcript_21821/g.33907 Transcript_21821/m.33907 type:complete len:316 (+) Transcript_21821:91-1038(+)|eukprot:CAMPEP_0201535174 /NCGR_PEP_ID=MMETSP0161_2-20130828/58297_1 /ASSEMBLY_ACC=CAM_ASM_000251 /TAXON_ID=180227 /ORGANISM="Neoparamoeba aestuarina, Strain SoJaBio B1-5/56/2" /LENGTH=315 /DNA_ID=CAMNT_0047940197 /DNA_START=75 /DNA_END=1019 /DNA_ORIENTATION=-